MCHTTNVFHTEEIVLPNDAGHGGQQSDNKYLNQTSEMSVPFSPTPGNCAFLASQTSAADMAVFRRSLSVVLC